MPLILVNGPVRHQFGDAEFPLAIGLAADGTLLAGTAAEAAPLLWLLAHAEGLSIQPERGRKPVLYNGAPVEEAIWLQPGDAIEFGDVRLSAETDASGRTMTLTATRPAGRAASDGWPQPAAVGERHRARRRAGRRSFGAAAKLVAALFGFLLVGAIYVVVASPVQLRTTPAADAVSWSGFPPPLAVGGRYLALPGTYTVELRKAGYATAREAVTVAYGSAPVVEIALRKLPGRLTITTLPADGPTVFIDGEERGVSPLTAEVEAGQREIHVVAERYTAEPRLVEVRGLGEAQAVEIVMQPAWGAITVSSAPEGAVVRLAGKELGQTPLRAEVLRGTHTLEISKTGWKPVTRDIDVHAGEDTVVPAVELERIDGTLELSSEPRGAAVTVNGEFHGHTPLALALVGERPYRLEISKAGYVAQARSVQVEGGKTARLGIELQAELGTVFLTTSPPGATVLVNGKPSGSGSQRITLQTVPQTIEVTRPGYVPFKTTVTPQRDVPKRLDVTLKTVDDALRERAAKGVFTPGGQRLALVHIPRPVQFTMGSSRREPGRRSNEVEYPVRLTRSYFISEKEVTNAELRKFRPQHASGTHLGNPLDGGDQPAVNVSWDDAARYANWLSTREGLTPAYKEEGGRMVPVRPLTNGYRLPTEAEWEFAARHEGGRRQVDRPLAFPWGAAMPPPANSGNYAQEGSRLPFAMPGYADAFGASAPVGKFAPNGAMIYDLGGNVAEWCHDYYDVPPPTDEVRADPDGPEQGRFHVIKGSSWRSGTITELRLSHRDYAEKGRDDLGFRVVRYVDGDG